MLKNKKNIGDNGFSQAIVTTNKNKHRKLKKAKQELPTTKVRLKNRGGFFFFYVLMLASLVLLSYM